MNAIKTLDSLSAWSRGVDDLRGAFVVVGREAIWIPTEASTSAVASALRYFIGGLPHDLLGLAGAALRGENHPKARPEPEPQTAKLFAAVHGKDTAFIALRWNEDREPWVAGISQSGRLPTGRLSPVRILGERQIDLGDATLSISSSESTCPEPTFEGPDEQLVRPILRSLTTDPSSDHSAKRSLGEALERYAMGSVPHSRLRYGAAQDLPGAYLDPSTVVSYTEAQRKRQGISGFSPTEETWWIEGTEVSRAEKRIWIPAALVFAPFPEIPPWTNSGIQSSNGAAYHLTPREAIVNGWLELVERDAFLRAWRHESSPILEVPPRSLPPIARSVRDWIQAQSQRNSVTIALLPSPTRVPVCAMVASGPTIGIAIGAGAAENISDALLSAACECACHVAYPAPAVASVHEVAYASDHAGYYRFGDRFRAAERLSRACETASTFAAPVAAATPRGYVVELEVPTPFPGHAVKVIDPSLIPLTFGHDNEPLGRHLREVHSLAEIDPVDGSPTPHPFP